MRVSVIVPYVEDRGYLNMCLESIRNQTVPCELIEVKSPRSVALNFNRGLGLATGELVKVVGDDDWLPLDSIENLVTGIGNAPWAVANAIEVTNTVHDIYKPPTLDFEANVLLNRIHNGGTIYRTEVLREIGGMDETLWTGEEYEMHLRLMSKRIMPKYINKEVYYYRRWQGQKSRQLRQQDKTKRANEIKRIQSLYSNKV
jgi:glycosyltransferase involved in cell wall biosynthesis